MLTGTAMWPDNTDEKTNQPKVVGRGSPPVSTADIMLIQESLQVRGLYNGEVDGIPGAKTLRAVRSFKKQSKIPVNNELDDEFVSFVRQSF